MDINTGPEEQTPDSSEENLDTVSEDPITEVDNENNQDTFDKEEQKSEDDVPPSLPNPPENETPEEIKEERPPRKKPNILKIVLIIIAVLMVLILLFLGGAVAIAYDQVNIGSPSLQKDITNTVQGIGFMPKTPRYILSQFAEKNSKETLISYSVDANLDVEYVFEQNYDLSPGILPFTTDPALMDLQDYTLTINLLGDVDNSNPSFTNARGNIYLMDQSDLNAEFVLKENTLFVKINDLLSLFYGMEETDEIVDRLNEYLNEKWIRIDSSFTEDMFGINERAEFTNTENIFKDKVDDFQEKNIQLTEETLMEVEMYLLSFDLTLQELSQAIEGDAEMSYDEGTVSVEIWFDKEQFYIRRLEINNQNGNNDYLNTKISFMVDFSNHNIVPNIQEPVNAIPFEEAVENMTYIIFGGDFINPEFIFEEIEFQDSPMEEFPTEPSPEPIVVDDDASDIGTSPFGEFVRGIMHMRSQD